MKKIYNWEELKNYIEKNPPSGDNKVEVDLEFGRARINYHKDDYEYLSTHTFYGKGDKNGVNRYPTKILQECGVNVEIIGDGGINE